MRHCCGPPLEILTLELIYFLIIAGICALIYLRTKELYILTKHKGIFYFRNIFLFFGLAYFFRLLQISLVLFSFMFEIIVPRIVMQISFFLVGYFSVMSVLSVYMVSVGKNMKKDLSNTIIHNVSLIVALVIFFTRSNMILIFILFFILIISIIMSFKKPFSVNKVTFYSLLFVWILNLIFIDSTIPFTYKTPLYILSIAIFISIYYRFHKRLADAKA